MPRGGHHDIDPFTLLDTVEAGVVVHGADTAILYANPKALELLGLTRQQALGKSAADPDWRFLGPDSRPLPAEQFPVNRVIGGRCAIRDQLIGLVGGTGQRTTWARVSAYPEYDGAGRIAAVVVSFIDVTDHIRSERLREAQLDIATRSHGLSEESLLQLVLRWCEDITGSTISFFHFVNPDQESIELVTWSRRTLLYYCHVEEVTRHYPLSQAGIWADAARSRRPVVVNDYGHAENKRGLPTGHAGLDRFISMPLLEGDMVRVLLGVGNKAYAYTDDDVRDLAVLTDQVWRIVSQKRTATRARELAQAVEQTPATIVMTDRMGLIRYVNPAFTDVTGYAFHEVEGRTPSIVKSGETAPEVYEDLWVTITAGGIWSKRLHNRRKDGSLYWSTMVISPLRDGAGEIIGYLGVGEDVTEQVSLEEQLQQAQKMEVIGQLTGGIAHDFNNYLAIISGNLELLDEQLANLAGAEGERDLIADALWSAERGAELTAGLLAFARQQTLKPRPTDVNQVVLGISHLLKRTLGEKIAIATELKDGLEAAMVDRAQLESALVNLAVNARDAMPDGGRLQMTTDDVILGPADLPSDTEAVPGEYVMLAVTDTGSGMPADICERIFEPFFTTKRFGRGSGLGLSMVYGFIRQSGGHVAVHSELGQGTTITLYLPRAAADGGEERETAATVPVRGSGDEVVLVVEDDERVLRTVAHVLRRQGYSVIEARRATDALDIVGHAPRLDLMFTDVVLAEGMNGRDLAKIVRRVRPEMRVLLTSGYGPSAGGDAGGEGDGLPLLAKPYRRGELARAVREALDRPAAGARGTGDAA